MNLSISSPSYTNTARSKNLQNKSRVSFGGNPEVKMCGTHDKPSILAAMTAAKEAKADNLMIGLLLGITHESKEKVKTEDAPDLIKYAKELSFNLNTPVKLACVTHLTKSDELINLITTIEKNSLNGKDGLINKAEQAKKDFGYQNTEKMTSKIFDVIQIHDSMPMEEIAKVKKAFPEKSIIKAVHVPKQGESYNLDELVNQAIGIAQKPFVDGLLLDSSNLAANQIGGTGLTNNWDVARAIIDTVHSQTGKPVALAGGLNPDNVTQSIEKTHADMIDANSGYRFDRKGGFWKPSNKQETSPKDTFAVYNILNQSKKLDTNFSFFA
ncbi:MAG: phosphoribosylanthranilate isomerase [Candidatus Margulisiibacteriota bacterium]